MSDPVTVTVAGNSPNVSVEASPGSTTVDVTVTPGSTTVDVEVTELYSGSDVREYANLAAFPGAGLSERLYIAIDTGYCYRWSGSAYVQVGGGDAPVTSVAGRAGDVVITTADLADFEDAVAAAAPPTTDASLLTTGTLNNAGLPSTIDLSTAGSVIFAHNFIAGTLGVSCIGHLKVVAMYGGASLFQVDSGSGQVSIGEWRATDIGVAYGGTGASDAATARTNLGVAYGSIAGTVCQGNDSRLSDARNPTSHAHGNITNDGAIGADAERIPFTTTGGALTVSSDFRLTAGTGAESGLGLFANYGRIQTWGFDGYIQTNGANGRIGTLGENGHIFTDHVSAFIQTRSTFNLITAADIVTTLSHAPTANRAIAFPDADGTVLLESGGYASNAGVSYLRVPSLVVETALDGNGTTIQSTSTATRTLTLPDASGTVVLQNAATAYRVAFDVANLTDHRTYTVPDTDGTVVVASSDGYVTGLNTPGYLLLVANSAGPVFIDGANVSAARTYTLPDADGTLALLEDASIARARRSARLYMNANFR